MESTLHFTGSDLAWLLLCGFLVALMQAGFTALESGLVRSKNSINVAIKNLVDFCIGGILYFFVGFGLMFGVSAAGLWGTSLYMLEGNMTSSMFAFFFFQSMFAGTAATIVSGAVAERMRFKGYIISTIILAIFIYPIVGHWVWNGMTNGVFTGWLGAKGFVDFAGSSVVHSVAGWTALAAILVIGPRLGRFGKNSCAIEGHNLPIAALGVFLLWFGWFGFNGGSGLVLSEHVPLIITNTALAGAAGGVVALFVSWLLLGRPVVDRIMNGIIAGLVSITASSNLMSPIFAIVVGAIGGVVAVLGMAWFEHLEIDDVIGAVPTHLFAGVWGTLAVALFAPAGSWGSELTRLAFFYTQLEGVVVIGAFSFGVAFSFLKVLNHWFPLRVSADDERIGLNIAEHGASSSVLDLITQMDHQARTGDYSRPVEVEPETEAAHIAMVYNGVLEGFNTETSRRKMAIHKMAQLANYDTLTGLVNRRVFFDMVKRALSRSTRHALKGAVLYLDLDGFKQVNDTYGHDAGDRTLVLISQRMTDSIRENDVLARVGGDEFSILIEDLNELEQAQNIAEKIIDLVSDPIDIDGVIVPVGVSIGITSFFPDHKESVNSIIKKADHAMYTAKLMGKNSVCFHSGQEDDATMLPLSKK